MIVGEISKDHRERGCIYCKSNISLYWFEYEILGNLGGAAGGLFCLHCFKYAYYTGDNGTIDDTTLGKLIYAYNMLRRSPWYNTGISFEADE